MRFKFLVVLSISIFAFINSYSQLTINEFLHSAESDLAFKRIDEQAHYLNSKPYSISIIDRAQLRYQNKYGQKDDLNYQNRQYGLRLTPSNPWTIHSTNDYFKTYSESLLTEKELIFKKVLVERYTLILEVLYYRELKTILERDRKLLNDQIAILEKQISSDFFNPSDYAALKLQQIEKQVEFEETQFEIGNQIDRIDADYTTEYIKQVEWDYSQIISVERIDLKLDSMILIEVPSSILSHEEKKIELARQTFNIEKANKNLGFIQSNYTTGTKVKFPWSFSVGVTLPITNPNKGDMTKKQLAVIEETSKRAENEIKIKDDREIQIEKLRSLIARYKSTQKNIQELNINTIGSTLSTIRSNNPVVALKINSQALKLQTILLKIKQSIMLGYIDFLAAHDRLQQKPLINYLSPYFEPLD